VSANETIVISGAGSGIGRAVALQLAEVNRHVTLVGRRPEPLETVRSEIGSADVVTADLATVVGAEAVAANVETNGRNCVGLVAAAGGLPSGGSATLADIKDAWTAGFESNVLSAVLLVEALRVHLERHGGRVVLLSSVAALRGSGGGPYGAVKAALHGWMYDLAQQLGTHGGTANALAPGFVPDTGFWEGRLTDESRARRASQTLLGREGTPAEVASLIAWLLGPDGGWVTGQVLSPNGGAVLGR
jgi:3-oxoacyl-[acyl-carrier protein] reductase